MTQQPAPGDPAPRRSTEDLAAGVRAQERRITALSGAVEQEQPPLDPLVRELAVAHEELRALQDDLLDHQRRMEQLVAERADPASWRRRLFDALPVPSIITDPCGRVLDVNGPARQLLGRRHGDMVQRPLADMVAEADRATLAGVLADVARGGTERARVTFLTGDEDSVAVDLVAGLDARSRRGAEDGTAPDEPAEEGTVAWVLSRATTGRAGDAQRGLRAAEAFAEMTRLPLSSGSDTRAVLAGAALLVERALPSSDGVSITFGDPAGPDSQATDNAFAQAVDGAQLRAGEGPCLDAYSSGLVHLTDDVQQDARWPVLGDLVAPTGVRSVLACPVRQDRRSLGVLNVYSRRPAAFDDQDRDVADLLVAAVRAVVQETRDRSDLATTSEQLRRALESRAVIDQAKGILMARGGYDAEHAFAQLVAASRRTNVKLREVARLVVQDAVDGDRPD